jgi:hypothetical protein
MQALVAKVSDGRDRSRLLGRDDRQELVVTRLSFREAANGN